MPSPPPPLFLKGIVLTGCKPDYWFFGLFQFFFSFFQFKVKLCRYCRQVQLYCGFNSASVCNRGIQVLHMYVHTYQYQSIYIYVVYDMIGTYSTLGMQVGTGRLVVGIYICGILQCRALEERRERVRKGRREKAKRETKETKEKKRKKENPARSLARHTTPCLYIPMYYISNPRLRSMVALLAAAACLRRWWRRRRRR